jgi:hypothetical protein
MLNPPTAPEIPWYTFNPDEIHHAINNSSPKKAPGPDPITFACLRKAYEAIPKIFNALYSTLGK